MLQLNLSVATKAVKKTISSVAHRNTHSITSHRLKLYPASFSLRKTQLRTKESLRNRTVVTTPLVFGSQSIQKGKWRMELIQETILWCWPFVHFSLNFGKLAVYTFVEILCLLTIIQLDEEMTGIFPFPQT